MVPAMETSKLGKNRKLSYKLADSFFNRLTLL